MMNIISILKFYLLDQTKMSNNDIIEKMLWILKTHSDNILDLCNVFDKMIECMSEIEECVTVLEAKRHRNDWTNKHRMSKVAIQSKEPEWIL